MISDNGSSGNKDVLADNILQNIYNREALIERLEKLHQHQSTNQPSRQNRIQRLLYGIHNASLSVVEAIEAWNRGKQDDWYRKRNIDVHAPLHQESPTCTADEHILRSGVPCPYNIFFWNGQNYLQKMLSDLDFVGDIIEAISCLGSNTSFHRNPFLLPLGVDELIGPISPCIKNHVWNDINLQRIRTAAFVLLFDEYRRKRNPSQSQPIVGREDISCRRRDAIDSTKFEPPILDHKVLKAYAAMNDPPATAAVAICCAHLVLGSVDADIIDKLIYLTKAILLKIVRQPLVGLIHKARVFNPLRCQGESLNIFKLVYPFVMHQKMDPELMIGVSDQIVLMTMWLRALAIRLVDEDVSSQTISNAADKIFRELEADNRRGDRAIIGSADLSPTKDEYCDEKSMLPDDANKENEGACKNVSVQTEEMPTNKQQSDSTQRILRTILGNAVESTELIPFPVAITVNLREGSKLASVNGQLSDANILKSGDLVRIHDALESSNWTVASSPKIQVDGSVSFHLDMAYDHSRIVDQEMRAKNDILNRLCYPYKKDTDGNPVHKLPLSSNEERTRHVASDVNESTHSPLHIKEARIWKLIPDDKDTRTTWRREYDNGVIPWERDNTGGHETHFRVRIGLEMIEQSCVDSPYPIDKCVHQQRVNFFESVPLSDVIDEAFRNVCRWHPKGTLIDNVKWAKLSRKMKFLSNVKNSKHEIDMAFVRRNQDRKLDLPRFRSIFEDIAAIQYPALSREVCKVL